MGFVVLKAPFEISVIGNPDKVPTVGGIITDQVSNWPKSRSVMLRNESKT